MEIRGHGHNYPWENHYSNSHLIVCKLRLTVDVKLESRNGRSNKYDVALKLNLLSNATLGSTPHLDGCNLCLLALMLLYFFFFLNIPLQDKL